MPKVTTTNRGQDFKTFTCTHPGCTKSFSRSWDLRRHDKIHSGYRSHTCLYPGCDKSFIQSTSLTVHMRTHTGERPYPCHLCGRGFSDSSSMNRHVRSHSGEKYYCCTFPGCSKSYCRRTTLRDHVKSRHVEWYDPSKPLEHMFLGEPPMTPLSPSDDVANDHSTVVSVSTPSPQAHHSFEFGDDQWTHPYLLPNSVQAVNQGVHHFQYQPYPNSSSNNTLTCQTMSSNRVIGGGPIVGSLATALGFSSSPPPISSNQVPTSLNHSGNNLVCIEGFGNMSIATSDNQQQQQVVDISSYEQLLPRVEIDVSQHLFTQEFMSALSSDSFWTRSDNLYTALRDGNEIHQPRRHSLRQNQSRSYSA